MLEERYNTLPDPHSFLDCKHLSIADTHKAISGETSWCTLCTLLPYGLLRGMIVLEGFVGNLLRFKPRSTQEVKERYNQQMVLL
jgi:hypothetical protein